MVGQPAEDRQNQHILKGGMVELDIQQLTEEKLERDYERHPLSEVWGDMPEWEFEQMVDLIKDRAVHSGGEQFLSELGAIHIHEDRILDGWHRYRACKQAEVVPLLVRYAGSDSIGFVIAKNAMRRHLTPSQRAACIIACREMAAVGRPDNVSAPLTFTNQDIADEAGVHPQTISQIRTAERGGLGDKVRSGELTPRAAADEVRARERGEEEDGEGEEDDRPQPERHTPLQQKEIENQAQRTRLQELTAELEEAKQTIAFHREQQSEEGAVREKTLNNQRAEIRTLTSQVQNYQTKLTDAERRVKYLEGKQAEAKRRERESWKA